MVITTSRHPGLTRAIEDIVSRAIPLRDRRPENPSQHPTNSVLVDRRIERWSRVVGDGDPKRFEERLKWDGLSPERVPWLFASQSASESFPSWATVFAECCDEALQADSGSEYVGALWELKIPIEQRGLLCPFLRVARRRQLAATFNSSLITEAVLEQTLRSLCKTLSALAGDAIELESAIRSHARGFRTISASRPPHQIGDRPGASNREDEASGNFLSFFSRYAVLARLLATAVECWAEATGEFLRRLSEDWSQLQLCFGCGQMARHAVAVWPDLSDPHHRHRSVWMVEFDTGLRLIYKPRPAGLDVALNQLLSWANERHCPLPFKILTLLARPEYHWVEFIAHRPCEDQEQVVAYFRRIGFLLAILRALNGKDVHDENVIAHGEHPVLIDTELLITHPAPNINGEWSQRELGDISADSILDAGLLPSWDENKKGEIYDVSGLGSGETSNHLDGGSTEKKSGLPSQTGLANVAIFNGKALSASAYTAEIVGGFRSMYRFLVNERTSFFAPDGPFSEFAAQPVRFVHNATQVYASLLKKSRHPTLLRNAVDRSIELDLLTRRVPSNAAVPANWPVITEEIAALERLDFPRFTADSSSNSLPLTSGTILEHFFVSSATERLRNTFMSLNEEDCERQANLIAAALDVCAARDTHVHACCDDDDTKDSAGAEGTWLTYEEKISRALTIARELSRRAVRAPHGGTTWIGLQRLNASGRYRLRATDFSLYWGRTGIAVFLAAAAKAVGDNELRDLAWSALRPLTESSLRHTYYRHNLAAMGPGGALGLGSVVYALTCVGRWFEDGTLLEAASRIAEMITPSLLLKFRSNDVATGSAGALLALLTLHDVTAEQDVLERLWNVASTLSGIVFLTVRRQSGWDPETYNLLPGSLTELAVSPSH